MAEGIGVDGLHCISGTCDLCGEACDANTQELNVLSCTFKNCEDLPYHQDCLEKYLKSIRLERNRKTGFKCPRGCGKGTKHSGPCPGKIDKSHPIHPRNEEQKKKKKAKLPEIMAVAPARVIKTKEEKKAEKDKAKAAAAADKAKPAKAAAAAKPPAAPAALAASSSKAAKQQQQQPDSKKLAEAVAAARREIAATRSNSKQLDQVQQQRDASPSQPEYKTLDAYLRESNAANIAPAPATPVVNAWAKPPAPAPHALAGAAQQQRHRPAEASRLQAATLARDTSPVAPAATAAAQQTALGRPAAPVAVVSVPAVSHLAPAPPPPPAAAAAAQPAHQGLHHVHSIHSHPLATQGSTASLVSQASGVANGAQLPVGAEYVGEEGHLTKAQRKNLKRAEKKKRGTLGEPAGDVAAAVAPSPGIPTASSSGMAAAAAAGGPAAVGKLSRLAVVTGGVGSSAAAGGPGGSSLSRHASSTPDSLAAAASSSAGPPAATAATAAASRGVSAAVDVEDEDSIAVMYELAVHALLAKKTLALVASLQRLGFTEWQAAAAVQRHGSELEDAVAWLLDGGAPDPEAAAAVSAGCVADVSIVEELRLLEALGAALPQLPRSQLYITVADAGGDLDKAAAAAMQQHNDIVRAAEEEEAAAAAAAAAAVAATPADSTCSPMASVSVTASPTSTSSATHPQQQQQQQYQQQKQQQQLPQQQLLPNGVGSGLESDTSGLSSALGLYSLAAEPTGATAAAVESPLVATAAESHVSSSGFGSWFVPTRSSGGLGGSGLTAHPLQDLPSTSSLGQLEATTSGFGSYVPGSATAAAAAAMGSNIWGTSSLDTANSTTGWSPLAQVSSAQLLQQHQQPGELLQAAASGGLFGQSSLDTGGLSGWGSTGLTGQTGLGLLNHQGAAPDALHNPYAPFGAGGSLFASPALAAAAPQPPVSTAAPGDAGLQQSRLFSSYGVTQPSMVGNAGGTQQQRAGAGWGGATAAGGGATGEPETAGSADTDDDLEGLLATLMCH